MSTPDDNELRRILGNTTADPLGGYVVSAYAVAMDDPPGWVPPRPEDLRHATLSWPCTMDVPSLTDEVVKDLLARVQRLEQQVADLSAKKPRQASKKRGA